MSRLDEILQRNTAAIIANVQAKRQHLQHTLDLAWFITNTTNAIRHIDATLEKHDGDIPRGELVKVWDLLEGRATEQTEKRDGN